MISKIKNWFTLERIIYILVLVGVIVFLSNLDSCRNNKFKAQQQSIIDSVVLANQKLVQDTGRLGQLVVKQGVIITQSQKQIKDYTIKELALTKKDENRIKQVNALVKENTILKIQNHFIPFKPDTSHTYVIDNTKPCPPNTILVPRELVDTSTKDFKFYGRMEKEGLQIDSLQIPDTQHIALVETKGGLFKRDINKKLRFWTKPSLEVIVTHTNKLLIVTGLNSITYQPKVRGRWVERLAIAAASAFITFKLLK